MSSNNRTCFEAGISVAGRRMKDKGTRGRKRLQLINHLYNSKSYEAINRETKTELVGKE